MTVFRKKLIFVYFIILAKAGILRKNWIPHQVRNDKKFNKIYRKILRGGSFNSCRMKVVVKARGREGVENQMILRIKNFLELCLICNLHFALVLVILQLVRGIQIKELDSLVKPEKDKLEKNGGDES